MLPEIRDATVRDHDTQVDVTCGCGHTVTLDVTDDYDVQVCKCGSRIQAFRTRQIEIFHSGAHHDMNRELTLKLH